LVAAPPPQGKPIGSTPGTVELKIVAPAALALLSIDIQMH
jgi:hypothetical protein